MSDKIFVTYSWENQEYNDKVLSFVDFLRNKGFNADLDQNITQSETAINFKEMMFKNLTNSSKVIILLSETYRERANNFTGGVGTEYRFILSDIDINPKKYILCTFSSLTNLNPNSILPNGLFDREIISIFDDSANDYKKLSEKLSDFNSIELSPVSSNKPILTQKKITPFESFVNNNNSKKKEIFIKVKRYLIENKQILMQYGPPSFIASKNPLSDAHNIWNDKKSSTVIPNNSIIISLIEPNIDCLTINEQEIFYKFKEHALSFELSCTERLDSEATIRFPKEFENMINDEVSKNG